MMDPQVRLAPLVPLATPDPLETHIMITMLPSSGSILIRSLEVEVASMEGVVALPALLVPEAPKGLKARMVDEVLPAPVDLLACLVILALLGPWVQWVFQVLPERMVMTVCLGKLVALVNVVFKVQRVSEEVQEAQACLA